MVLGLNLVFVEMSVIWHTLFVEKVHFKLSATISLSWLLQDLKAKGVRTNLILVLTSRFNLFSIINRVFPKQLINNAHAWLNYIVSWSSGQPKIGLILRISYKL